MWKKLHPPLPLSSKKKKNCNQYDHNIEKMICTSDAITTTTTTTSSSVLETDADAVSTNIKAAKTTAKATKATTTRTTSTNMKATSTTNINNSSSNVATTATTSTIAASDDIRNAVLKYIRNQSDIYIRILTFQSLDLDEIYHRIHENSTVGSRITKPILLNILDTEAVFVSTTGSEITTSRKKKQRNK